MVCVCRPHALLLLLLLLLLLQVNKYAHLKQLLWLSQGAIKALLRLY
jgi:hypothetical protein